MLMLRGRWTLQYTYEFVRQSIDELWCAARKVDLPVEELNSVRNLALLEVELRKRSRSRFAIRVDPESLLTACLGGLDVLLELIKCKTLVDECKNICRWGSTGYA